MFYWNKKKYYNYIIIIYYILNIENHCNSCCISFIYSYSYSCYSCFFNCSKFSFLNNIFFLLPFIISKISDSRYSPYYISCLPSFLMLLFNFYFTLWSNIFCPNF